MMDYLQFYVLYNSIYVTLGRWMDDIEWLGAIDPFYDCKDSRLQLGLNR